MSTRETEIDEFVAQRDPVPGQDTLGLSAWRFWPEFEEGAHAE